MKIDILDIHGNLKHQEEVPDKELASGSHQRACSVDRRDGVEVAASEIVMLYVGFPSLSEHERVCGIIRKEIATRGVRPLNAELSEPGGPVASESGNRVAPPGFAPVTGSGAVLRAEKR